MHERSFCPQRGVPMMNPGMSFAVILGLLDCVTEDGLRKNEFEKGIIDNMFPFHDDENEIADGGILMVMRQPLRDMEDTALHNFYGKKIRICTGVFQMRLDVTVCVNESEGERGAER